MADLRSARRLCFLLVLAGLHASSPPTACLAGPGDAGSAADEKKRGDDAFDRLRFSEALDHYRVALASGSDARLHYNIAQVLAALGRFPEALLAYQQFLVDAPAGTLSEVQQRELFKLIDDVKSKTGRLEVRCDVAGARVLVRGSEVGRTPILRPLVLNAGASSVEIIADGYRPFEAMVDIPSGGTKTLHGELERVDFTGTLVVRASIEGAQIVIDGKPRGPSPVTARLQRGVHNVVAKAPDYLERAATVNLEAGETRELPVSLRRAPSYTLVYAGFGVAAAGIGVGAAAGLAAYSKFKPGDCDPVAKSCGPASHADLDTSKLYGTISTVGFAVGTGGAALGIYSLLKSRNRPNGPEVSIGIAPGHVGAAGRF